MEGRFEGRRRVALISLAIFPLAILAFRSTTQHWVPLGDNAIMGLRIRDVFTAETPLVGAYSKFGWSHPGPLLFYLHAVPYRLLGSTSDSLLVGSVLVNAISIVVLTRTLLRTAGMVFTIACLACVGFTMWTLGTSWLWFTWNPNLALLAFAAFLALAWSVSIGRVHDLPWLAGFGTLVVQSHVGYALVVGAVAVTAGASCWHVHRARTAPRSPVRRPLLITLVVLGVLWFPPALEAIQHEGGNLRALANFWTAGHQGAGWHTAVRIMGLALSERGPWLGFAEPVKFTDVLDPRGTPIPWAFLALVTATIVAARRRDVLARNLCVICLVAIAAGAVAMSRIVGDIFIYMVFWTRVIAAFSWIAAAWALLRALPIDVRHRARRAAPALVAGVGVAVLALLSVSALSTGVGPWAEPGDRQGAEIERIMPDLVKTLGSARHVQLSSDPSSFSAGTFHAALDLELAQRGYRIGQDTDDAVRLEVVAGSEAILDRRAEGSEPLVISRPSSFEQPPRRRGEDFFAYLARVSSSPIALYRTGER